MATLTGVMASLGSGEGRAVGRSLTGSVGVGGRVTTTTWVITTAVGRWDVAEGSGRVAVGGRGVGGRGVGRGGVAVGRTTGRRGVAVGRTIGGRVTVGRRVGHSAVGRTGVRRVRVSAAVGRTAGARRVRVRAAIGREGVAVGRSMARQRVRVGSRVISRRVNAGASAVARTVRTRIVARSRIVARLRSVGSGNPRVGLTAAGGRPVAKGPSCGPMGVTRGLGATADLTSRGVRTGATSS